MKAFSKRPSDLCARYGGEEFALVLGNTNLKQASVLLETLLNQIYELQIKHSNNASSTYLTASIGLAQMIPDLNNSENDLLNQADAMLYKAKAAGRNTLKY